MTLRLFAILTIVTISFTILLPRQSAGAESNEAFVRENLERFFLEVFDSLDLQSSADVFIDFDPPSFDKLNVTGTALSDAMDLIGLERRRQMSDGGDFPRVRMSLSRVDLEYENRDGTPFSRGDLYRVLQVAGSFSILQGNSVLGQDFLVKRYEGRIELDERRDLESDASPLFHADLPAGPVQRFWEPVIVTSVVGGLVYLFFASR